MAARSPSNSKVRIDPPKSMTQSLADSESYAGESCASVNTRYEARSYDAVPDGPLAWHLRSSVPLGSFGNDVRMT